MTDEEKGRNLIESRQVKRFLSERRRGLAPGQVHRLPLTTGRVAVITVAEDGIHTSLEDT